MPSTSAVDTDQAQRHAQMIEAGGRDINGQWHSTYTDVTTSCLHPIGHAHHDQCTGWCNPLAEGTPKPCACPHHDDQRMSHQDARDLVALRLAAPVRPF